MTAHFTCTERVYHSGCFSSSTCSNRAKHDPVDGIPTKCGVHSKAAYAKREEKRLERDRERSASWAARQNRQMAREQAVRDLETLREFFRGKAQLDWPDDVLTILSAKGGDDE